MGTSLFSFSPNNKSSHCPLLLPSLKSLNAFGTHCSVWSAAGLHALWLLCPITIHPSVHSFGQTSVQDVLDVLHNQVYGNEVVHSPWYDHICIFLCGETELFKRRLHKRNVLCQNTLQISATLTDVTQHSSGEPCVCVCVHKQLHLEQVSDLLRVKHEDPLEQHHISRVHSHSLLLPGVAHEVVHRYLNSFPLFDVAQSRYDEFIVKSIRVVEVELPLQSLGFLVRGQDSVEAVLAEDGDLSLVMVDLILSQQLHDLIAHG